MQHAGLDLPKQVVGSVVSHDSDGNVIQPLL